MILVICRHLANARIAEVFFVESSRAVQVHFFCELLLSGDCTSSSTKGAIVFSVEHQYATPIVHLTYDIIFIIFVYNGFIEIAVSLRNAFTVKVLNVLHAFVIGLLVHTLHLLSRITFRAFLQCVWVFFFIA